MKVFLWSSGSLEWARHLDSCEPWNALGGGGGGLLCTAVWLS